MLTLMALLRLYFQPLTRRCWVTRSAASVFQLPLPTNQNSRIGRLVRALHLSRVHQDPEKCFLSRGFVPNYVWMFSGSPSRSGCLCTLCIVCPRHSYSSYASSYASANKAIYMLSMFLWSPDATPHTRHPSRSRLTRWPRFGTPSSTSQLTTTSSAAQEAGHGGR